MKLTSKVLNSFQGVAYGHMTLEAMQNWRLSKIDLLVREVVQNGSDAADNVVGKDYFSMEFNIHKFNGRSFMDVLDGLNDETKARFSDSDSKCLEIRDGETTGLTGPHTISHKDEKDHGNYYRLVFDTGKAQTQKYSGGNWGYGKSAYYGVGKGFVIYYSQIKEEETGLYKSLLIVTLIENEESDDAILRGHKDGLNSAGKAWWGKCLDGSGFDANILPLEDENEIREILDIFGIAPFAPGKTGTSVIIPYVDYSELMTNMISEEMDVPSDVRNRCAWTYPDENGFKEYLKLSLQKWYAPVINNSDLPVLEGKKWLYARVNGELINYDSMYPFFQLVQRLYTAALAKTHGDKKEKNTSWTSLYENSIKSISIRNYIDNSGDGNTVVGYLATVRLPSTMVNRGLGENLNPFLLLGYYEESGSNRPIVMYSRRLGMVIDYAYKDEWVHGVVPPEDKSEYVFSFFVPCLGEKKRLKSNLSVRKYAGKTLEEYLISCEASDHEGWEDHDRMALVSSIQGRVADSIKNLIRDDLIPDNGTSSDRLGNALSKMFNITKGKFGAKVPSGSNGGSGGTSISRKISFISSISEFGGYKQVLKFKLTCKPGVRVVAITPVLVSDGSERNSSISSFEWENEIRSKFPVEFEQFSVFSITEKDKYSALALVATKNGTTAEQEGIEIKLCQDTKENSDGSVAYSQGLTKLCLIMNEPKLEEVIIEGDIHISTLQTEYEYDIVAAEEMR